VAEPWYAIAENYRPAGGAEPAPAPVQREQVPDGWHTMEIVKAEASDRLVSVHLKPDDKRFSFVFCDFYEKKKDGSANPKSMERMSALATALGLSVQQWISALRSDELVGRRVSAKCRSYRTNVGKAKVEVDEFSPVAEPVQVNPRATVSQRIGETAQFEKDDIPF
jgi:hypothetical protein